jgi:hypothetical protein
MEHTKTTETSLLEENIPMMDHNIKWYINQTIYNKQQ